MTLNGGGGALKTLNCLYNSLTSKLKIMLNDLDGNIHIILAEDSGMLPSIGVALSKRQTTEGGSGCERQSQKEP